MEAASDDQIFLEELKRWYARGDRDVSAVGPVDLDRVPHETPLGLAARRGWCSAIDWLVKKGADVNKADPIHMPLHGAVARNRLAAARSLLDAGADVNARNKLRKTPLHFAADLGDFQMCKLLLSHGADSGICDMFGVEPEEMARRRVRGARDGQFKSLPWKNETQIAEQVHALLVAVREAGGWQAYLDAPRRELLAFRRQLPGPRRRANAPAFLERLFLAFRRQLPGPRRRANAPTVLERLFLEVPEDVFTHTLRFWRTDRDA